MSKSCNSIILSVLTLPWKAKLWAGHTVTWKQLHIVNTHIWSLWSNHTELSSQSNYCGSINCANQLASDPCYCNSVTTHLTKMMCTIPSPKHAYTLPATTTTSKFFSQRTYTDHINNLRSTLHAKNRILLVVTNPH